jgi:hemerythrin-like domain-containing protein
MPQHRRVRPARRDALAMLEQDHIRIVALFDRLATGNGARAQDLVRLAADACAALEVHSQLEEDLFYPAVRHEISEPESLEDGLIEHHTIDALAEELRGTAPGPGRFAATARVLAEQLRHHIAKEERRVFPQVRRTGLDLAGLGEQLRSRQAEILAQRMPAWSDAAAVRRVRPAPATRYPGFAPF